MNQQYNITYDFNPKDPIGSLTQNLISTINDGTINRAITIYKVLGQQIGHRGNQGKDIRYVERQLRNLSNQAKVKAKNGESKEERLAAEKICSLVDSYIDLLPKPVDNGRDKRQIPSSDLEEVVEASEEQ